MKCDGCYEEVKSSDKLVHDRYTPWHPTCRQARMRARAAVRADEILARGLDFARLLVDIQTVTA